SRKSIGLAGFSGAPALHGAKRMALNSTDWIVIIVYLAMNLLISLYYRRRSSGSTEEFFVSGRNVSWWLAGTSMVATTFAADTPLFVTGVVARNGIAGNWIWWSQCLSGMMTVFFLRAIGAAPASSPMLNSSSSATKAKPPPSSAASAPSISAAS